jgi:hypothetical protein
MGIPPASQPWRFGVQPLDQTLALAPLLRRVTSLALSPEHEDPALDRLLAELRQAEASLSARAPADPAPRVGAAADESRRVYLDHSQDIGSFNPAFPEYTIEVSREGASGTVAFPLVYEGPPGIVHGGFLALFFDCAIQDHNCAVGQAGKTATLTVSYRRPVPLLQLLDFEIERAATARRIRSTAHLALAGQTLATATVEAAAGDRARLPDVWPRRRSG